MSGVLIILQHFKQIYDSLFYLPNCCLSSLVLSSERTTNDNKYNIMYILYTHPLLVTAVFIIYKTSVLDVSFAQKD